MMWLENKRTSENLLLFLINMMVMVYRMLINEFIKSLITANWKSSNARLKFRIFHQYVKKVIKTCICYKNSTLMNDQVTVTHLPIYTKSFTTMDCTIEVLTFSHLGAEQFEHMVPTIRQIRNLLSRAVYARASLDAQV